MDLISQPAVQNVNENSFIYFGEVLLSWCINGTAEIVFHMKVYGNSSGQRFDRVPSLVYFSVSRQV